MGEKKSRNVSIDKLSFEQAVDRLRQIVEKVETGQVGLEESIQQYELGCKLIEHCRTILDRAEHRIEVLTKNLEGTLESRPAPQELKGDQTTPSEDSR